MCNGKVYQQVDGVSMGSSLGPVLANVIMTEMEKEIIEKLHHDDVIKFYIRYVDDTLVLAKPADFMNILHKLNSFHPQLKFTYEEFDNQVHFLDILFTNDSTTIYRKSTHTGQYTHHDSYEPWFTKIAWIRSLASRAFKLCSNSIVLATEIQTIKQFLS
jgi:hypothetical protein